MAEKKKQGKPRGLAAVSPERRAEIARMGGKAAQASGKANRFDSETAKAARVKPGSGNHRKDKA